MQNNFNISNTDIVTMLMVQKTKELEKERTDLMLQKLEMLVEVCKKINKDFEKLQVKWMPYLEATKNLITLYNPKAKFELTCRHFPFTTDRHMHVSSDEEDGFYVYIHLDYIDFSIDIDPDSENKWNSIEPDNGFYAPVKFVKKYKLPVEYTNIMKRSYTIGNLLANKEELKDQIIAKVTENALLQSTELKLLAEQVKLDL